MNNIHYFQGLHPPVAGRRLGGEEITIRESGIFSTTYEPHRVLILKNIVGKHRIRPNMGMIRKIS